MLYHIVDKEKNPKRMVLITYLRQYLHIGYIIYDERTSAGLNVSVRKEHLICPFTDTLSCTVQ